MCSAHAAVRGFVGELVGAQREDEDTLLDMEAGLEHLSRGTGRHVDCVLAVLEPYYRALETGRRVVELALEGGVSRAFAVANKVHGESDRDALGAYCGRHDIELIGEVPFDGSLPEGERAGRAPLEHDPGAPAVRALEGIARELRGRIAPA